MKTVVTERLRASIGKEAEIYLENGFKYFGKLTNIDDRYAELIDYRIKGYKLILISDIKDVTIYGLGIDEAVPTSPADVLAKDEGNSGTSKDKAKEGKFSSAPDHKKSEVKK